MFLLKYQFNFLADISLLIQFHINRFYLNETQMRTGCLHESKKIEQNVKPEKRKQVFDQVSYGSKQREIIHLG